LESPLEPGGNTKVLELSRLYIGILNEYDLISSKLMRGTQVDVDDSLMLVRARRDRVDVDRLIAHFHELASYDISEARVASHLAHFIELLREEGLYGG
jgi:hypothetical protein